MGLIQMMVASARMHHGPKDKSDDLGHLTFEPVLLIVVHYILLIVYK